MDSYFSGIGIQPLDFIGISANFILNMLFFFGIKDKKHSWINVLGLITLSLQCILVVLFKVGLEGKLFAALMLVSALTVELVVARRRKPKPGI